MIISPPSSLFKPLPRKAESDIPMVEQKALIAILFCFR
uniref:Uncharacterized protein n=1 Tax=Siphoviridae sp. ct5tj9 TaxID=2823564 RepID=A0A8S5LGH9_9CAUD|nr:MAG TPA: hypothetical protein [Siphoviridae sp. ct5tj9]DAX19966.1 MAG TPA: hypothetical protein [Caudoviricetes sp.]